MAELIPCPFCGGEAEYKTSIETIPVYDFNGAIVDVDDIIYFEKTGCLKCDIWFYSKEGEEEEITIERWNRRADDGC